MKTRTDEAMHLTKIFHHVFTDFDPHIKVMPILKQWLSVVCYTDVEKALNSAYMQSLYTEYTNPLNLARQQLEQLAPQDMPFSKQHPYGGRYAKN